MLLKQYHSLEKHCISLEVNNQLTMEIFQRDTVSSSESAPTFAELFETNELKAQIQEKDTYDDLINKVNLKSVEVADLNASLQEKVLVITALKEQLKGKAVSLNPVDPALLQVDVGPLVPKLRVALVSSASGSQSQDNTKKNRIRRTHKKAKETKLEDHPRKVKSSLNKSSVVDSRATSFVIKSVSNVNSNLKCASCNGC
nr:hypothetical protein [Tanacetum cinerariifolium]